MKKKLASLLVKLAIMLNPEAAESAVIPETKEYEASAIGTAWAVTDKDIRQFRNKKHIRGIGKARKKLIDAKVLEQHNAILKKADELIFSRVYNQGKDIIVESRLNVYVPKKASN